MNIGNAVSVAVIDNCATCQFCSQINTREFRCKCFDCVTFSGAVEYFNFVRQQVTEPARELRLSALSVMLFLTVTSLVHASRAAANEERGIRNEAQIHEHTRRLAALEDAKLPERIAKIETMIENAQQMQMVSTGSIGVLILEAVLRIAKQKSNKGAA